VSLSARTYRNPFANSFTGVNRSGGAYCFTNSAGFTAVPSFSGAYGRGEYAAPAIHSKWSGADRYIYRNAPQRHVRDGHGYRCHLYASNANTHPFSHAYASAAGSV